MPAPDPSPVAVAAAMPPAPTVSFPEGIRPGPFWESLGSDLGGSHASLTVAAVILVLIVLCRAALAKEDRSRLRMSLGLITTWVLLFFGRAELITSNDASGYATLVMISGLVLGWSGIAIGMTFVMDVFMRRRKVPKIVRDLSTGIGFIVALVIALSRSGVNLLSLITTSAVLTAVIGLALQDTLGNLMSGIALQMESSLQIGEWVKVGDAVGRVREIRWRSTTIETKNGELVILPNGQITKDKIINFHRSGLKQRQEVIFDCGYQHPPSVVQETILAALRGVPNVSPSPPPEVLVHSLADSGVRYRCWYWLDNFDLDERTDSEVLKRIYYACMRAGLEIPYPTRSVYMTEITADRQKEAAEKEHAERLRVIAAIPFFAPLDEAARAELARRLRREVFARGETIIRAGEPGDTMYVLHSGEVSVRIVAAGVEKEVATLRPGNFFGEMSLMTGEPRRATVVARQDAESYVISTQLFNEIIQNNTALLEEIARLLAERQAALQGTKDAAQASRNTGEQQALLGRIKSFFGLGG